jgi:hypothetical protein
MKIEVTQEDIDTACPVNPECCPIANAIKRRISCEWVGVGSDDVRICVNRILLGSQLPLEAKNFISVFDRFGRGYQGLSPFSFEIRLRRQK